MSGATRSSTAGEPRGDEVVLSVRDLTKHFPVDDSLVARLLGDREFVRAVRGVSFDIQAGETLALVGESGSGKSTVANLVTGLHAPTGGEVIFRGQQVGPVSRRSSEVKADIGMVFQDPTASLDPRVPVRKVIAEPMRAQGWARSRRRNRVDELLALVGLSEQYADRYPHELSGGQAQRVAIARAVALDPDMLVLDEPVSALDVSVQAKILNLLMRLQDELDLTYLFIAHDLNVVEHIADRVAVMYLGKLMEMAPTGRLFERPANPYTYTLLSSIPDLEGAAEDRVILEGDVPSPVNPPTGCPFHTRCPYAEPECSDREPGLVHVGASHSRCLFADEFYDGEIDDD